MHGSGWSLVLSPDAQPALILSWAPLERGRWTGRGPLSWVASPLGPRTGTRLPSAWYVGMHDEGAPVPLPGDSARRAGWLGTTSYHSEWENQVNTIN
ncbi:hypothetical protein DPEC_G00162330 [Dallia pectoralis]|uniref:Uncharacterized protein n=1 Tax=Dallia pectoralis TaxID=75939 RepID=A0ACC2GGG7_DALPE|nr:hypothetical protein DPEC_G00162330 [Dallia pectoralis]